MGISPLQKDILIILHYGNILTPRGVMRLLQKYRSYTSEDSLRITVYKTLRDLFKQGYLSRYKLLAFGKDRLFYKITEKGEQYLQSSLILEVEGDLNETQHLELGSPSTNLEGYYK